MADSKQTLKSIKSGMFSRGIALAKVSVSAGARAASHAMGTIFADEGSRSDRFKALLTSQMGLISKEFGQLKGSVMKVGQMLSMHGEHLLPPEANALLKSLQSQSPALAWAAIEKSLLKELGPDRLAELEIDRQSYASASMGQVHLATIKSTGEVLALKIQYPGVDKAVDSDLAALRRILSVAKLLPKGVKVDELFDEVREMLMREVDYRIEAEATRDFGGLLKDDPRYRVARVHDRYSTSRVIATEFIEGVAVDSPEVAALSQERRDRIGEAYIELYFRELFEWRRMQTDPHFGNYRVQIDPQGQRDRLVLLDFGAVREFPLSFLKPYYVMVRGAYLNDAELMAKGAIPLGFLGEQDPPELKRLFSELCALFGEPLRGGAYDWAESELPKKVIKKASEMALSYKLSIRTPPREVVFLDRKMGGVYVFLNVLKSRVQARSLFEKYLPPLDFSL